MKKVTKIVTVAASAMCAFAVMAGSFAFAAANNKAYAAVAKTYAIEYKADSNVTVKGPRTAKAGSRVDIELSYNYHKVEILGVRVGDEYAAKVDDMNFYFAMPDGAATVVVESKAYGEDDDIFPITNVRADAGVYLDGCPASARAGDVILFQVSLAVDAPYTFANYVEIVNDQNKTFESFDLGDGFYGFIMPNEPVSVFTLLDAKYFFLDFAEEDMQYVYTVQYTDNVSMAGAKDVYAEYNEGEGYYLPFGSDVLVTFIDSYVKTVTGVKLNSQEVTFENQAAVKFTMPGKDIELQVVTADFYRPVHGDDDPEDFFYEAGVNYNYEFFRSATASGEYVAFDGAFAMYGDYVRCYVTPKDDMRKATGYQVIYKNVNGSYYSASSTTNTDTHGTYVQFQVGTGLEYYVAVSGQLVKAFTGYQLLGDYRGYNVWKNEAGSITPSRTLSIDEWGTFKDNGTSYSLIPDGDNTPATGEGTAYVVKGQYKGKVFYGNNFFVTAYSSYSGNTFTTYDLNVYYKYDSTKTTKFNYHLYRTAFGAVEVLQDGAVVARLFYTIKSGVNTFYTNNVEFEFTSGSAVNDPTSVFVVKANGVTLGTVSGESFTAA